MSEIQDKNTTRSDASRAADRKYNKKRKFFTVSYSPTDIDEAIRLQDYLDSIGMSTNQYLKSLIKADLDDKNFPYHNNCRNA